MKRKYLNTLTAFAVLAALWAAITYSEKRKTRQASKIQTPSQEKVLSVDSTHVQSFTLKPRNGEVVSCRREGGTWLIAEPRKLRADQTPVSGLLTNLTDATIDQVVDQHPSSLKDFGLDPPAFTIDATLDRQPAKFTLLLGDETPTSGGIYAQIAGNPRVVTLASYLKSSLEKNLFDLRDKRAIAVDASQIQRIRAESKGKRWALVKNPENVWDVVLPPAARADRFTVDNVLDRLKGLTMQTVVKEDKKNTGEYGFGAPALRVVITSPGGTETLVLGKKDGKADRYLAMNSALEPVFTVGSDVLTQLQKDPSDLLDKALFSFSTSEVKKIEMETPQGHRTFEQEKAKWKQTAPTAKDEASDKVQTLLSRLVDFRAIRFPKNPQNLAAFGLAKPSYRFQVQFGDKNESEIAEVSKVDDHVYARRSTDPIASELIKNTLDDIERMLKDL